MSNEKLPKWWVKLRDEEWAERNREIVCYA